MTRSLGLLVGMIIGAGIFALPYTVARAGFYASLAYFFIAASLVTTVHLLYGHVLFENHERHRLPGYMRANFGEGAYWIALLSRLFSYYGYLLAYGVLGGTFLSYIFSLDEAYFRAVFFIALAPFLLVGLPRAGAINLLLTIPLILFVIVLFVSTLLPTVHIPQLQAYPADSGWFFPYGIFLFAFSGASIIPEIVDLYHAKNQRAFRRMVIWATIIVALIYLIFIAAILAISPYEVSRDALASIRTFRGGNLFVLGALIGVLAIITSYIPLGLELRYTFEYDLKQKKFPAWIATAFIPLVLFLAGANNFISILKVVGAIGIGIEGICIIALARKRISLNRYASAGLILIFIVGALLAITE